MARTKHPALTDSELAQALTQRPGWARQGAAIVRSVKAKTFPEAIALVGQVADAAQAMDHHPDILIEFTKLTFTLTTHDSGGVTALDLQLAKTIDELAEKAGAKASEPKPK